VKFNGIKCELNKNASFVEGRDKMGLVGSEACTLVLSPRYLPLQGTIMFWLKPLEDLRVSSSKTIVPIIKSKNGKSQVNGINISLEVANQIALRVSFGSDTYKSYGYTHLKKNKAYHFAVTWDALLGRIDLYLYGIHQDSFQTETWHAEDMPIKLKLGSDKVVLEDLRFYSGKLSGNEIREIIGFRPKDRIEDESITVYEESIDTSAFHKELIYEQKNSLSDWILEGPGEVWVEKGSIYMQSKLPDTKKSKNRAYLWLKIWRQRISSHLR